MNLRPYQLEAVDSAWESIQAGRSPLIVMPTGTGKSVVLTHLCRRMIDEGKRVMVLAHRRELIEQLTRHAERGGLDVGIEMADFRSDNGWFDSPGMIVASKDSLRGRRLRKFDPDEFGLVVTDEAHHATAKSYRNIYEHFDGVPHLGVTATPDRADGTGLGHVFDEVAFQYCIRDAIGDGWLVPVEQRRMVITGLDLSGTDARKDFTDNQIANIIQQEGETLHQMVGAMVKETGDKRCLVFLPRVDVAQSAADIANRTGYAGVGKAECVWGDMDPELRSDTFSRFSHGQIQYLLNVAIATEGWDDPADDGEGVQVLAMMRPTKSRALYTQAVGRVLRPIPGIVDGLATAEERKAAIAASNKPVAIVIDFVGNSGKHDLVTAADVLAGKAPPEVVRRVKELGDTGETVNDQITRVEAEYDEEQKRIEAERKRIARERDWITANVEYRTVKVDAFSKLRFDDSTPSKPAGMANGVYQVLLKNKVPSNHISAMTPEQAGHMAQELIRRRKVGLCTYKQAIVLKRNGIDPANVSFAEAGKVIDELAANGWRKAAV